MNTNFSEQEFLRYARHFILPKVGTEGQMKLKSSRVLIVGAGGLGSPLAMYLCAAGIGTIGIVDFDVVDFSNLQRQILHSTSNVGKEKVFSAKETLTAINPDINVQCYHTKLTSENALGIFRNYDIVADGSDNFPTRYLVNDACVLLEKPLVYGSIFRFEGEVSVFNTNQSPCYRCLHPVPPPPHLVPSCAVGGVFGALPGIIGSIQATEVLKLLLNIGSSLAGKVLFFDAMKMEFRELLLKKNFHCSVCGKNPSITSLIDYEEFCSKKTTQQFSEIPTMNKTEITVNELQKKIDDVFLLDVREQYEFDIVNLSGYLIPLKELPNRIHELDSSKEIVVYCHHGNRSSFAMQFLNHKGFANVKNLVGGIDEWARKIDTNMKRY
ncbi:MAG: molybdopterin-synthase adenylyltransferase MoeB [Ignavibacteria bacterium]|nr:molybdopterin-synthase adenylyltransferase MoeB [Ignavibacteria bacterium]